MNGPVFRLRPQTRGRTLADASPFLFGIGHPGQFGQEALGGIDVDELHAERPCKDILHQFGFTKAQKPVVDEDGGQLVTDRFVDQGCSNGGIHTTTQPEQYPIVADRCADLGNRAFDE